MKDRTLLAIKGLAIIGVVFHHVLNRRADHHTGEWLRMIMAMFDWCVLAFFCVSGYLQALSDSRKKKSVWEFTTVRFHRLLVPYILLFIVYAVIWQVVQALHISGIGARVPEGFIAKLKTGLWPVDNQVAQQLYYLPLLFGVSLVVVMNQHLLGMAGMWVISIVTFGIGLALFPAELTGFSLGVFLWAICFYTAGYLLFQYREKRTQIRVILLIATVLLVVFSGYHGLSRSVPLWLITEGYGLRIDRLPILPAWGDASGTIYIYHTPFIIQPLAIAITFLHGAILQFAAALVAVVVAISICYLLWEFLKDTRARVILM
jgi:acyltransferase